MIIILNVLLWLISECHSADLIIETKTVDVGDEVKLTCNRQKSTGFYSLFWIRLVSGGSPEMLGGTSSADGEQFDRDTPHFNLKQEPGVFLLRIKKTKFSDNGIYLCMKLKNVNITFLKGVYLDITVPEPKDNDHTDAPPGPKEPLNLQCSIVSNSKRESCPRIPSVHWFRGGSPGARPSFVYVPGGSSEECGDNTVDDDVPPQKCLYNFCKEVSSSDTESYYCAVATCGQILFGRATRQNIEEFTQKKDTVQNILVAGISISLVLNVFLIYFILKNGVKKKHKALPTEGVYSSQQCQQTEDSLVYCSPRFSSRNEVNDRQLEEETVYSHVRTISRK